MSEFSDAVDALAQCGAAVLAERARLADQVAELKKQRDDAVDRAGDLWTRLGEAMVECERLRDLVIEACGIAEEGWGYAGDYFNEKWDAPSRIADLRHSADRDLR